MYTRKPGSASKYDAAVLAIHPPVCQIRNSMDVTFGAAHEAFRQAARAWLAAHVPSEPLPPLATAAGFEAHRAWQATMFADRWSAVHWPTEYGGRGLGIMEWLVFEEEYERAGGPARVGEDGTVLLAPALLEVGTLAQKERFLPAIAAGQEIWCRAWSASDPGGVPAAGRATRSPVGEGWHLNGRTTLAKGGSHAQWCFGMFRTHPEAGRDQALTTFLVPLGSSGVTLRPLRQMDGGPAFAEILFEDVQVPHAQVLGAVGTGWSVAMSMAAHKGGLGLRSPARAVASAARLVHLFDQRGAPAAEADGVARAYVEAQANQLHAYWTASKVARGQSAGPDVSCHELVGPPTDVAIYESALALLGSDAELLEAGSPGAWVDGFLAALTGPFDVVTNQMQRSIVAERLLGLGEG